MAQHDYAIANQGFPAFRSDLNDALAAIVSNNSGATEPTTMFAHQMWVDTAANPSVLKMRNADNDAWITLGVLDQTGDTFILRPAAGSATVPAYSTTSDTNTGLYFPGADRVGITTGGTQRVEVDASGNLILATKQFIEGNNFSESSTVEFFSGAPNTNGTFFYMPFSGVLQNTRMFTRCLTGHTGTLILYLVDGVGGTSYYYDLATTFVAGNYYGITATQDITFSAGDYIGVTPVSDTSNGYWGRTTVNFEGYIT